MAQHHKRLTVLVKGAGDVGSAVAHALFQTDFDVVLWEVAQPSTARRGMSFAEAMFIGQAELEGVRAVRSEDPKQAMKTLRQREAIPVYVGSLDDLRGVLEPNVMIDARMRKRQQPEIQLGEAPLTIGLGPGFQAGRTTHLAVETSWGPTLGAVLDQGETEPYTGQPRSVLGYGRERYSYAPVDGVWHTHLEIGEGVAEEQLLGDVAGAALHASIAGVVRGITRNGVTVARGAKLVDVDPRGEEAVVVGIAERPRRIAEGVVAAVQRWARR